MRSVLRRAALAAPTYDGPGVRGLNAAPGGFALHRYDFIVGHGSRDFARASEGLRTWATHAVVGVHVAPASTNVHPGGVFVVTLGTALVAIGAPCRVTRVTDEATRFGFSYRTLPGHPERGEEAFDVHLDAAGDVRLEIAAVSQHAGVLMGLAAPFARVAQRFVTTSYGRALRRYVCEV